MSEEQRLKRLAEMAGMVLDARSAEMARIASERDALKAQLAELNVSRSAEGLSPAAAAQALFSYEAWASRRRSELNLQIAAKQAEWLSHLEETRQAFGRNQVLSQLVDARAAAVRKRQLS